MSTPDTAPPAPPESTNPPEPTEAAPPNPDLQGLDLLNQAYNEAGKLRQVLLSAKIGGALQTMTQLIGDKVVMQSQLERLKTDLVESKLRNVDLAAQVHALTPAAPEGAVNGDGAPPPGEPEAPAAG